MAHSRAGGNQCALNLLSTAEIQRGSRASWGRQRDRPRHDRHGGGISNLGALLSIRHHRPIAGKPTGPATCRIEVAALAPASVSWVRPWTRLPMRVAAGHRRNRQPHEGICSFGEAKWWSYGRDFRQRGRPRRWSTGDVAKSVTGTVRDGGDAAARVDRLAWDGVRQVRRPESSGT